MMNLKSVYLFLLYLKYFLFQNGIIKTNCRQKIMRDPFHYWTIINYDNGTFVKTFKVPAETVWKLLWPKWKNSFDNPYASDPRIGGSVSTKDLKGEEFEVIIH